MLFPSFRETILNDLKSMPYKVELFARQVFYSLLLFDFHNDFFVKKIVPIEINICMKKLPNSPTYVCTFFTIFVDHWHCTTRY